MYLCCCLSTRRWEKISSSSIPRATTSPKSNFPFWRHSRCKMSSMIIPFVSEMHYFVQACRAHFQRVGSFDKLIVRESFYYDRNIVHQVLNDVVCIFLLITQCPVNRALLYVNYGSLSLGCIGLENLADLVHALRVDWKELVPLLIFIFSKEEPILSKEENVHLREIHL